MTSFNPSSSFVGFVRSVARRWGISIQRYHPYDDEIWRFARLCELHSVQTLLDVGAANGSFAMSVRSAGFTGRIFSFEPLSESHAKLRAAATADSNWHIAPRCGLGSQGGIAEINVAGNLDSSSFLPMLGRHVETAPQSRYVSTEKVPITTLEEYLDSEKVPDRRLALKMDTQGYELEVLRGLGRYSRLTRVIHTEASLTSLYQGGVLLDELYAELRAHGYRCVSMVPIFTDPKSYELLQANLIFVNSTFCSEHE